MAIHFDFIVDEIDAENILDCVHSEICRALEEACTALARNDKITRNACQNRADYLKHLKGLMTNKEVNP